MILNKTKYIQEQVLVSSKMKKNFAKIFVHQIDGMIFTPDDIEAAGFFHYAFVSALEAKFQDENGAYFKVFNKKQ